ncbi:NTP/NDP exchange transporter [Pseudotamlana agarivorans]|uniref:NTP/NDP exchange transporter n=1 Tax=Pseudotamlana agarivorans TaxID=481183 RepID=UPI001C08923C|nr:Npt1/Npt2 family nucleotide transporter [Tamlana agarivorans]
MQLYIFIVISVLLMVKPTISALFLSNLGASELPNAYLIVAVTAVLSSYFYDKSLRFFSIKSIAIVTLLFFSACFLALGFIIQYQLNSDFILYAYYVSVSLFGVLVTSQFWIIANMVYNAREAKRLFGFIGSGAIAGGIFGGYLTTIISKAFGNLYVIYLASGLILVCIPIIFWVWNHRLHNTTDIQTGKSIKQKKKRSQIAVKIIFKSKHLTYLALTVGVSVIMAKLVDYQFSDFANLKIQDPNELASFFGFWFSSFNVASLLIQLFLTNRLLAWLGVTSNLLLLPLGIAMGCLLFLVFPELWVLILLKGVDGSFKQSINKAAVELSIMPIPYEDKKQAKSFIDVVVDSIATGIAGFLLIFVVRGLDLHEHYITVIILFFLFVWIILIYQLRNAYFDTFKTNILSAIGNHDIDGIKTLKKALHASVIKVLTSGGEEEIINLLERLGDSITDVHKPHIIKLLDHPSNLVKAAAIKEIYYFKHGAAASKVNKLIEVNNDREVVYEAMEYMLLHTKIGENNVFKKYLDHRKKYIADAALLCLAELAVDNKNLVKKYGLHERLRKRIKAIEDETVSHSKEEIAEFLVTVGYARFSEFFEFIKKYLKSDTAYILKHAIKAAGLSGHDEFIKDLLPRLNQEELREVTISALHSFGNHVPNYLLEYGVYENLDSKVKKHLPKVLATIKNRDSLKLLIRLGISSDPYMRFEAVKVMVDLHFQDIGVKMDKDRVFENVLKECEFYLQRISIIKTIQKEEELVTENTALQISMEQLVHVIQEELDCSMHVIFEILSLVLNEDDMEIAYFGLKDEAESVKVNSIEFLDNILHVSLKAELIPIVEYHFIEEREIQDLSQVQAKFSDVEICLITLLKDGNVTLKLAALHVLENMPDASGYKNALKPLTRHAEAEISNKAHQILNAIKRPD